jgi:type II secretory pathway component PulK
MCGYTFKTRRSDKRTGSAFVLVLLVLMGTVSMVSGIQHLLVQRSISLRIQANEQRLRSALILGLQVAVDTLAESEWTVETFFDGNPGPKEFLSSDEVYVQIQLQDAQDRFNLNDLSLPLTPGTLRSPWDMFEDLLRAQGVEVSQAGLNTMRLKIEEEAFWFESPDQLALFPGDMGQWDPALSSLSSLPRPSNRALTINLNTVRPEVLRAMVGSPLHGWADSVLEAREQEPIRNVETRLRTLPEVIRPVLEAALDVRSDYVETFLVAEVDQTRMTLRALLHRGSTGEIEVVRCLW